MGRIFNGILVTSKGINTKRGVSKRKKKKSFRCYQPTFDCQGQLILSVSPKQDVSKQCTFLYSGQRDIGNIKAKRCLAG